MANKKVKGILLMRKMLNVLLPICLIITLFVLQHVDNERKELIESNNNKNIIIRELFLDYCIDKGGAGIDRNSNIKMLNINSDDYFIGRCVYYEDSGILLIDRNTNLVEYYIKEVEKN